jgi:hypothetical protein
VTRTAYQPALPTDFEDVAERLECAHAAASDAATACKAALDALCRGDLIDGSAQLNAALDALLEATREAQACELPLRGWAEEASGDW